MNSPMDGASAPHSTTWQPPQVQTILARLEGVKTAGDGRWYARCPAHDDKSPSLSIRDTGEKILIHCFAGCDSEDVLTAVGLAWNDLYPDPWQCAAQRPNEGAQKYVRRTLASLDPRTIETAILRIAAHRLRAGERLSVEEQARVEVAWERLDAWDQEEAP